MVFVVPLNDATYDADQKTMTIGSEYTGFLNRDFSNGSILISSSTQETGSYEGVNAFGVRKMISKRDTKEVRVTVPKNEETNFRDSKAVLISMSPQEARVAKPNLSVLFAGTLIQPYFSESRLHLAPKIDLPYDYTVHAETIHTNISCAAIYNRASGKVLQHLDITRI
jgi:hypothetical protein